MRLVARLVISFLFCACSASEIEQRPLVRGAALPAARPEIYLYVDDTPYEPYGTDNMKFRGTLRSSGFGRGEDATETQTLFSMAFRSEADTAARANGRTPDDKEYRLSFSMDNKFVPNLPGGETYSVVFYFKASGMFLPPAVGVVVRDETGALVFLISCDEAVPPSQLPAGFALTNSEQTASITTALSPSGCTIQKKHRFMEVTARGRKAIIGPGEELILPVLRGSYRVVLFDNSTSSAEVDCLAENPPHFSFMLQAVTED